LRHADPALERRGRHAERPSPAGRAAARRPELRSADYGQLRGPCEGARGERRGEPDGPAILPTDTKFPDPGEVPRLVFSPESGRTGERRVSEHSRTANFREPGVE